MIMDAKFERYAKLQALNIPEFAIRQRMQASGISDEQIDKFFRGSTSPATSPDSRRSISSELDQRFVSFLKMLKQNLPDEAIRQKMQIVGFKEHEINAWFESVGRAQKADISSKSGKSLRSAPEIGGSSIPSAKVIMLR